MKSKKIHLSKYLHEKKKRHVIFDFDETIGKVLVDWERWKQELIKILKKYNSTYVLKVGRSWAEIENEGIAQHGQAFRDDLTPFYARYESEAVYGFKEYETISIIKSLSGMSLSLWTANARKTVEPLLEKIGLLTSFLPIVTRDELFYRKPHHEGFAHIHKIHNLPLADYLFIGDSDADRLAAKGAGIEFLHVSTIVDI